MLKYQLLIFCILRLNKISGYKINMNDNKGRLVYLNGKYVPETETKISIFDSALMFGNMVFGMTRSFNKKQFKLSKHIKRLFIGMKILRIPSRVSEKN